MKKNMAVCGELMANDNDDDVDAGSVDDDNDDVGCNLSGLWAPRGGVEKMDRMKIIKRRLSMSLRSARPVDDSLSELAEQMALDEPSTARDNGEAHKYSNTQLYIITYICNFMYSRLPII